MRFPEYEHLAATMGIVTQTPYVAELRRTIEAESFSWKGAVSFSMTNMRLDFTFTSDEEGPSYLLDHVSDLRLVIPSRRFDGPVQVYQHGPFSNKIKGFIHPIRCFGDEDMDLHWIGIKFKNFPARWLSADDKYRISAVLDHQPMPGSDANVTISHDRIGWELSPAIDLEWTNVQGQTWIAKIREIPMDKQANGHNFECGLWAENANFNGATAWDFIRENLRPFLRFTFAGRAEEYFAVGYDAQHQPRWGIGTDGILPVGVPDAHLRNWFVNKTTIRHIDINPLFQAFCDLDQVTKDRYDKAISAYATSERVMALVASPDLAASTSFTALDSLVRTILASYPDYEDYLYPNLQVKPKSRGGRADGIKGIIKLVAERELNEQEAFEQASEMADRIRNVTFHADPTEPYPDTTDCYFQWQNTQTMVEMLLLKRLGMDTIPNRASVPQFCVNGRDIFGKQRDMAIQLKHTDEADFLGTGTWSSGMN